MPYEEEEEVSDATAESTPQEMDVDEEQVPGDEELVRVQEVQEIQEVQEAQEAQKEGQEQQGEQGMNTAASDEPQESPLSLIEERRRKKRSKYYKQDSLCELMSHDTIFSQAERSQVRISQKPRRFFYSAPTRPMCLLWVPST